MTSTTATSSARPGLLAELPTLADCIARPYDNFSVLRLILALAVVVSHAFSVSTGGHEPFHLSTGFSLGEYAVNGFFTISGFLVTMSFARRGWRDYIVARMLRIAPAFIVATLAMAAFGSLITTLSFADYWRDPQVSRFIVATLTTFKSAGILPGVFADNPLRYPLGTVWTLKYEVLCYLGVLVFGVTVGLSRRGFALAIVAGLGVAIVVLDALHPEAGKAVQTSLRLPFLFGLGAVFYLYRDEMRITSWLVVLLVGATWLAQDTAFYKALNFTTGAYGIIWLGVAPGLSSRAFDLKTDLSYGVYLLGWPVQQTLQAFSPQMPIEAMLPIAMGLSLLVALVSWHLVEKPALGLKARILNHARRRDALSAAP
ncbi:MAG: acyltransferase [Chelatococcus sp.]|uniref:acyltransferase family protein n=1 Tax=Chelatococcus sp. TaxID=1953771 RepID=UPI0025BEBB2B|nr:acyltransferase [Chelatococcus sp.]MBX3537817.1 acyltransferase [Chelatococcus sp.]